MGANNSTNPSADNSNSSATSGRRRRLEDLVRRLKLVEPGGKEEELEPDAMERVGRFGMADEEDRPRLRLLRLRRCSRGRGW
jgi:hypothetical protein